MALFLDIFSTTGPQVSSGDVESAFLGFIKILFVTGAFLYVAFSVIVVRQVKIMGETLETNFGPLLRLLGLAHLILALIVFFYFLTSL